MTDACNDNLKVLVFGGTFDPPHLAHAQLPREVADLLGCTKIMYIPAGVSPHKLDDPPTDGQHRLTMVKLMIESVSGAEVSTFELDRTGPSYTCDTLQHLRELFGDTTSLHFLMGADQALAFYRWKNWQTILEMATPAVMLRPPWDLPTFTQQITARCEPPEAKQWLDWIVPLSSTLDICSSDIRRNLAAGEDVSTLLPPAVYVYIRANKLYE